jgi:hypothetical protein
MNNNYGFSITSPKQGRQIASPITIQGALTNGAALAEAERITISVYLNGNQERAGIIPDENGDWSLQAIVSPGALVIKATATITITTDKPTTADRNGAENGAGGPTITRTTQVSRTVTVDVVEARPQQPSTGAEAPETWLWKRVCRQGRNGAFQIVHPDWLVPGKFIPSKEPLQNAQFEAHRFKSDAGIKPMLKMRQAAQDEAGRLDRANGHMVDVLTPAPDPLTGDGRSFEVVFSVRPDVYQINDQQKSLYWQFAFQDPFFYQDNIRSYFASPEPYFDIAGYFFAVLQALYQEGVYRGPDPANFIYQTARFWTFYHPYAQDFRKTLIKDGLEKFLSLETQQSSDKGDVVYPGATQSTSVEAGATFLNEYEPTKFVYPDYPKEIVDFSPRGAYSQYNWELFFHAPFLIATRLSKNQKFEEAQKWFHLIFDPTTDSAEEGPQRYWKSKPLYDAGQGSSIQRLMRKLADKTDNSPEKKDLQAAIKRWSQDPFKPHSVAAWRPRAYQIAVVMKYLDNLIAWGDQLFRRDTIESINEATQLYILAAELLGRRPQKAPPRAMPQKQTFNSLAQSSDGLDDFGNALVAIEEFIAPSVAPANGGSAPVSPLAMLYFCAPYNEKLLGYWDLVEDRLFKIRNCMNIEGVTRQLPLFDPPIDPAILVKAAAAGIDLRSAVNDASAALPPYRFNILSQKATELCMEVKSLGASMLSALEKRDAEAMALLRSKHEVALLEMAQALKGYQAQEAQASLDALTKSLGIAQTRLKYYLNLLSSLETVTIPQGSSQPQLDRLFTASVELINSFNHLDPTAKALTQLSLMILQETKNSLSEFDKVISGATEPVAPQDEKATLPMNRFEKRELDELKSSNEKQLKAMDYEALAQVLALIPDFKLGVPPTIGATFGGTHLSTIAKVIANQFNYESNERSYRAKLHSILGGYQRRYNEWRHQCDLILGEMEQIGKQMLAACMRLAVANQELKNHEKQMQNAREVDELMREKYTNQELYDWMTGQVSVSYFQAYQLAYDAAKRAERAYRFELGVEDSNFIQFGYWDSLKKGLLAGEKLSHDLKRMETAYLDRNKREYEITRHISLRSLDPIALIKLRQTGQCEVAIPEMVFDLDYPGHYFRRIKSVSLTIPCVTGPYTGVSCTLTLLKSSVRHRTAVAGGYARNDESDSDPRFRDSFSSIQAVVTSSGQNDSGLFETSLRDERYLPFEGSGAISSWRLEMPSEIRQFDYNTISDLILHIRYTAREGGQALKDSATANLKTQIAEATAAGMVRLFSARNEFPGEWARFKNIKLSDDVQAAELRLQFREEHYPYWSKGRLGTITHVEALARVIDDTTEIRIARHGADDSNGDGEREIMEGALSASPIQGLLRGTLSQLESAVPVSASGATLLLYFDNNESIEDLWLAVAWGGGALET